jgi:hypothetical protein
MVAVAQLVESRIVIPVVVGSSPIGHPKRIQLKSPDEPDRDRLGFLHSAAGKHRPLNCRGADLTEQTQADIRRGQARMPRPQFSTRYCAAMTRI